MTGDGFRKREKNRKQNGKQNGDITYLEENIQDEEFSIRESPMTSLIASSLHLRTVYNIFVVISLVLISGTMISDLVESGKVSIGPSIVAARFGGLSHGIKLWMYDFCVVMSFYPLLLVYSWTGAISRKYSVLRSTVVLLGVIGIVVVEVAVAAVPVHELATKQLELATSGAVTFEMFRFMMKLVSVASACGPRCVNGNIPLPTFKHYFYFMFAPTLLYRDQYPRTKKIRWGLVVFHFIEVVTITYYVIFLWEKIIIPFSSDYGKEKTVEAVAVVRAMFANALPGMTCFCLIFYLVLHAWLNAWAEMLRFGDRLFYEEWWTTSRFSLYYRRWNRVVYFWLRNFIYLPLAPYLGRPMAKFAVFFVSGAAHEVILSLSLGNFYPLLFVHFTLIGFILIPLTETAGRRFPEILNLFLWLNLFIGNGILWSLYPMEYFARRNCPPSENDSFFIPKSWSCPEIILKPN